MFAPIIDGWCGANSGCLIAMEAARYRGLGQYPINAAATPYLANTLSCTKAISIKNGAVRAAKGQLAGGSWDALPGICNFASTGAVL
ncbi:hypothetical protein GOBAR_DD09825 [Gossypium barbadense]|nr:hypothetical protein GOBAR_DD09825 [Gossypium barbadense]